MSIPPVSNAPLPNAAASSSLKLTANDSDGGGSFAALLNSAVAGVEKAHTAAVSASEELLTRGKGDIHEVALMSQRAELSLELFQQVRNKLVQAYQEVMRMPM